MQKLSALLICSSIALLTSLDLKADTLAAWTFQTSASTNNIIGTGKTPASTQTGILADIGSGTASAFHATAGSVWSTPTGNGSSSSWSVNNWSAGDYYQFSLSTIGYTNLTLTYDQVGSSTGPGRFYFAYSLDGSNFTISGATNTVLVSGFSAGTTNSAATFSYDLSAITSLANQSSVYFRVVDANTTSIGNGTVATAGTDRIDNFIVSGALIPSAVPEPSMLVLATLGGMACLVAVRHKH